MECQNGFDHCSNVIFLVHASKKTILVHNAVTESHLLSCQKKGLKQQVSSWAALSDEQMRKIWPFCLLNDEQMSNKVGVKHQPGNVIQGL